MTDAPVEVDLRAKVVHISVMEGDAWSIKVTLAGHNLTAATIAAQLRKRPSDTSATNLAITASDLAAGEFYVGQTAAAAGGYYDVQVTPSGGLPRTYLRGRLSVTADVTRA